MSLHDPSDEFPGLTARLIILALIAWAIAVALGRTP